MDRNLPVYAAKFSDWTLSTPLGPRPREYFRGTDKIQSTTTVSHTQLFVFYVLKQNSVQVARESGVI
jgi:hypothetical protein